MMPGVDGYQACQQLKADPKLAEVPVIFVTALGDLEAEARGLRLGAADYLTKPINVEVARLRIGNLLEREGMRRQLLVREAQLREALMRERLAASVFHHAREGLLICDARNRILDVNPMFSEMTCYSREEVLGRDPGLLSSGRQSGAFYQAMWRSISELGHWEGEVWNRRKDGEVYAQRLTISTVRDANGVLQNYIGIFADITLQKSRYEKLERLAHYDLLTGLPNRLLFADRLEQGIAYSRRSGRLMALCYLDLDGFKPINDRYGHEIGDRVLVEVARILSECTRAVDTVARLGGDEFVLLLVELQSVEQCLLSLERVLAALRQPLLIDGLALGVSASIGVSFFPNDSASPETLLRHADAAMYQAKRQRGGIVCYADCEVAVTAGAESKGREKASP